MGSRAPRLAQSVNAIRPQRKARTRDAIGTSGTSSLTPTYLGLRVVRASHAETHIGVNDKMTADAGTALATRDAVQLDVCEPNACSRGDYFPVTAGTRRQRSSNVCPPISPILCHTSLSMLHWNETFIPRSWLKGGPKPCVIDSV